MKRVFTSRRSWRNGYFFGRLERAKGIEPSYAAWEAAVLPLNYTRETLPQRRPISPLYHGRADEKLRSIRSIRYAPPAPARYSDIMFGTCVVKCAGHPTARATGHNRHAAAKAAP